MRVVVHVAAANADRVQGDLHVGRPDMKRQVDVAQGQLAFAFEDEGLHGVLLRS